jgi:2-haloacid dehalogenase
MVKDILFDLDDTIFDFGADERVALEKTFRELSIPASEPVFARYSELNLAQWKALERGEITRDEVKLRRFALLFDEIGVDASLAPAAARLYQERLGEDFHYIEGARELLETLDGSYRMYLISNGNLSVQEGRLKKSGIGHFFADVFISEVLGVEKPNRAFFDLAFERIPDFSREQTVLVGDSLTADIQGGINAGVRTIWFHPPGVEATGDIRPDYEITRLNQLPELLKTL